MAVLTRNVLLSLSLGILSGALIFNDFLFLDTAQYLFNLLVLQLSTVWILKTLLFVLLIGSIISLIEASKGIGGFIYFLSHKANLVKNERSSLILVYIIGLTIFIESSITALVAGAVGQPLSDRYQISRAKLAYVCDATSAPICSILLFNGWGALLLGLIVTQVNAGILEFNALTLLIKAVAYNIYAYVSLILVFLVIWFKLDYFAMKNAKVMPYLAQESEEENMYLMILPLLVLVFGVFIFLFITGDGDLLKGSGSSSILYAVVLSLVFMLIYYLKEKVIDIKGYFHTLLVGAKSMISIMLILFFAFLIAKVISDVKTGVYLAQYLYEILDVQYLAVGVFLIAGIIAFSTGTSWGTFSIMIPISMPLAIGLDANIALIIGAVISGGVFGDHCSPISDTTIISSMASGCDHIEHVKTQLPYALFGGALSALGFYFLS